MRLFHNKNTRERARCQPLIATKGCARVGQTADARTTVPQMERLLVDVETAAAMLSLHRSRLFPLMAQGAIRSCKIGKSRRIPVSELQRFIEAQMAVQSGEQSPAAQ